MLAVCENVGRIAAEGSAVKTLNRRRARLIQERRSPSRPTPNTPGPAIAFLLTGKDATGRIVATDQTDAAARADRIADTWRYCGLAVEVTEPR